MSHSSPPPEIEAQSQLSSSPGFSSRGGSVKALSLSTMAEPQANVAGRWLHYYTTYRVWVCKHCCRQIGTGPAAETHFRAVHKLGGTVLKHLLTHIGSGVDENGGRQPEDGMAPVEWAQPPVLGFTCSGCLYRTRNRGEAVKHSRTSGVGHGPCRRVWLQSWSPGNRARYWIVRTGVEAEISSSEAVPLSCEVGVDSDASPTPTVSVAFAARMQAYTTTMEQELAAYWDTVRQASAVEQVVALGRVTKSMLRVTASGVNRLPTVPTDTLIWLHSIRSEYADRGTLPFSSKQEVETNVRYTSIGSRYVCYCVRMARIGQTAAAAQYGVHFSSAQWSAVEEVVAAMECAEEMDLSEEEDARLDAAVLALWIVTVEQNIAHKWRNPLIHFCAVLAIRETVATTTPDDITGVAATADIPASYRWTPARDYTPTLAALVWVIRIMMLEQWCQAHDTQAAEMVGQLAAHIEAFREMHTDWLAVGSYSPISVILEWMSYGRGIREKEGGMPKVMWESDRQAIRYLGDRVTGARFQQMARTGLDRLDEMLHTIMEGEWARDQTTLDLGRITDSFMFESEGRSFLTDARNRWLKPGFELMAGRAARTLLQQGRTAWHRKRAQRRLRLIERFERALMREVHVWGGQPGRGLELTTIRYADTVEVPRNVYVFEGDVLIISDRDKNRTVRGFGRKVARFLPRRLGRMMVAYLAWIMPFKTFMMRDAAVGTTSVETYTYVWKDGVAAGRAVGPWTTETLTQELRELSGEVIGVPLGTADYRHVAIAFGAEIKGIMIRRAAVEDVEEDEMEGAGVQRPHEGHWDCVWDLQATHGRIMARQHYAIDGRFPWQLQPEQMFNFREISRLWHAWLEGPRVVSGGGLVTPPSSVGSSAASRRRPREETPTEVGGSPSKRRRMSREDEHAVTSPCVAPAHCSAGSSAEESSPASRSARELARRERAVARREKEVRRRERIVSSLSRAVYDPVVEAGIDNVTRAVTPGTVSTTAPVVNTVTVETNVRETAPPDALLRHLQQMYGPGAAWKTVEQRQAMLQVLHVPVGQALVVVLPTGGGKSVLFTLLGLIQPTRTHIVVVPFVALKGDLITRMRAAGVTVMVWRSRVEGEEPLTATAPVVVVSADSVNSESFRMYVEQVRARGRLGTIFVDEAHTVITDVSYRVALRDLGELRRYGRPLVLLTATLPPTLVSWFHNAMGLVAGMTRMVRASTVKANIVYRVSRVTGSSKRDEDQEAIRHGVCQTVQTLGSRMQGNMKGIVYCRSRAGAEQLAATLGCACYHSELAETARAERLAAWSSSAVGVSRWIVATSGLGTGIDIEGIVAIVHAEAPWGMVDFVQQTGRGGRRPGEEVESVVVLGQQEPWWPQDVDDAAQLNMAAMERFLQTTGCRRAVISEFMDGQAVSCAAVVNGAMCDRCSGSVDHAGEEALQELQEEEKREHPDREMH
ncbi:ATP-dependent DNA helicase tlh1, partial [Cyphellophora attinorum]